jgi:hypothetical protein
MTCLRCNGTRWIKDTTFLPYKDGRYVWRLCKECKEANKSLERKRSHEKVSDSQSL